LGSILVLVILFAPEGIYARLRARRRRAYLAAATLVVVTAGSAVAGWGIATDWLSTGLIAATAVLLLSRPAGRRRRDARRELAATPMGDAVVR
jgi:hypothetical protein